MSNYSSDLPVKLEELCQFTFNFNNLIKIIDYLHQNNLSLKETLNDATKRIESLEILKTDIDNLKIKTKIIEKTNDNLNRSCSNLLDNLLKNDTKISEMKKKLDENESKISKFEKIQSEHEKNLNNLNKAIEDNENTCTKLNDLVDNNSKKISQISEKIKENEQQSKENFENINRSIKELNSHYEISHSEIENINNNMLEMNNTIKNIVNNVDKKYSDLNSRIIGVIHDMAGMNSDIANLTNTNIINNKNIPNNNNSEKDEKMNITNSINKDMASANLFKIAMDEIEEEKNKLKKLKEDYESNKEKQNKENDFYKKNINNLIDELDHLKAKVGENSENIIKVENKCLSYIEIKNEESEKNIRMLQSITSEDKNLDKFLNKYITFDIFKQLSDHVSILKSSLNTKAEKEEMENQFKKMNQRLESIEMIQQGQTHGPKKRINLGLVNKKLNSDSSNVSNNMEEIGDQNDFDFIIKKLEKYINDNIINLINKEIENIDLTLNPKINELFLNLNQNREDIDKNSKTIVDLRNILISNPTKNDIINLKNEINSIEEELKSCNLKVLDITKNLEADEEDEDPQNALTGTIGDKIIFLNKSCIGLNMKISAIENKNKNLTKEVKDDIKQNLKNETAKIMQQFKLRLESFGNKFEYQLKNKIDQIGLSDFETKMNSKLHTDLKDKLDKNDLRKNNNMIKRKIDNLETKISKTLVDTIIDLQMEDQPLIAKKNVNGVEICASCNQSMPKNFNNNLTMPTTEYIPNNIGHKNKAKNLNKSLINFNSAFSTKLNHNSQKSLNLNLSLGHNKLPDIIPTIYQK